MSRARRVSKMSGITFYMMGGPPWHDVYSDGGVSSGMLYVCHVKSGSVIGREIFRYENMMFPGSLELPLFRRIRILTAPVGRLFADE